MTTIYELEAKATPGPWSLRTFGKLPNTPPCYGVMTTGRPLEYAGEEGRANAALLAHCRNHFMEALKLINGVIDAAMSDQEQGAHWLNNLKAEEFAKQNPLLTAAIGELHEAIEKLETVEVI